MKRILLALLVSLGLQTQAQINLCDSMTASGSQTQLVLQVNNVNTFIDYWCTNSTCGSLLGEDSMSLTHNVYNSNLHDTIVTCITWGMGATNTCCVTWIWDANMWLKMGAQQPYFCCDSITYWTDQSQGFNIGLDTTAIVHNPDSMNVLWSISTETPLAPQLWTETGMFAYFPQVMTTDTIKVCYDVMLWEMGVLEICTHCDTLMFDQNTFSWILFSMGNTTSTNELTFNKINDGKIYDVMGRELLYIPTGTMYIQNRKLYIRK